VVPRGEKDDGRRIVAVAGGPRSVWLVMGLGLSC
jgi:hypothetical protein